MPNVFFTRQPRSSHPKRTLSREWKRMLPEVELDVFDEDMKDGTPTESLFLTIGEARRKTEVNVRRLDKEILQLFNKA